LRANAKRVSGSPSVPKMCERSRDGSAYTE
jgi:hypothetical protein